MAVDTRDRMIAAATELFRERGYDGTGFRDVVAAAGTAKGVIYHHFPDGKTELGVSVATAVGERIVTKVEHVCATENPHSAVTTLLDVIERTLVRPGPKPGCPVAAVVLAADDEDGALRAAGNDFFRRIQGAIAGCLQRDGISPREARAFAALAVSACEGAILLCRAQQSEQPLRQVRVALVDYVDCLSKH